MKMDPILVADALSVSLGGTPVLHEVSVGFDKACWTAIVGPNGAGKSTLLRTLAGLQAPSRGSVTLQGRPLAAFAPRQRALAMAWLAQNADSAPELSAIDVVRLGRLPHHGVFGTVTARDEQAVREAMQRCECEAFAARSLTTLSGGERQRVLLARALAVDAPVLLLDEPTTHLDPPHQTALVRLMRTEARRGRCVASVLHDLTLALGADVLLVMARGRIVARGAPADATVQRALAAVFDDAIRIVEIDGALAAIHRL